MPGGQPTKYKEEYATTEFIAKFVEYCEKRKDIVSLCGLAVYLEVCEETIQEWKRKRPEFSVAVKRIKQISKNQLLNGSLRGEYSAKVACMALSANHGMNETQNQHVTGEIDQRIILGRKKK
jgi:hypothetical protein